MVGRREFLTAGILCGVGGFATTQAASATRSRLFVSSYPIRRIARDLVHGIGRQVVEYVKELPDDEVRNFLVGLTSGRIVARLKTLRQPIQVVIDRLSYTLNNLPSPERVEEFLLAIAAVAHEDDNTRLDEHEVKELRELYKRARDRLLEIVRTSSITFSYYLTYKKTRFHVSTHAQRGHFRIELRLLTPIREVTGALFVADLQERGACTYINTSLCINACVGRREGPLVRRIAGRVIGNLECDFLARLEREVYKLVHNESGSELKKMIPELVRRITDGA